MLTNYFTSSSIILSQTMIKPPYYEVKRWTLLGLCLGNIALTVCCSLVAIVILNHVSNSNYPKNEIVMMEAFIMTGATISIAMHLFGVFGSCLHSFCLAVTFNVFAVLATIVALMGAILIHAIFWATTVLQLVVAIAALLYLIDLRRYILSGDTERQGLLSSEGGPTGLPSYTEIR